MRKRRESRGTALDEPVATQVWRNATEPAPSPTSSRDCIALESMLYGVWHALRAVAGG